MNKDIPQGLRNRIIKLGRDWARKNRKEQRSEGKLTRWAYYLNLISLYDRRNIKIALAEIVDERNKRLKKGDKLYEKENYDKAISAYLKIISWYEIDDPLYKIEDEGALYKIGKCYEKKGALNKDIEDYRKALEYYTRVIVVNNKYLDTWIRKGAIYLKLEKWDDAINSFIKAKKIESKCDKILLNLGIAYFNKNNKDDWNKSKECFKEIIKINHSHKNAWIQIGRTFFRLKQFDELIKLCNKYINKKVEHQAIYYALGLAYQGKKNFEEAIRFYDKSLEYDSKFYDSHHEKGIAYGLKGEYKKAISSIKKALNIEAESLEALNDLGCIYRKKGEFNEGIKQLSKALEIDPEYEIAFVSLGEIYYDMGNYEEAKKHFLKALRLNIEWPEIWNNLGELHYRNKNWEKSIDCFKNAIHYYEKVQRYDNLFYKMHESISDAYINCNKYEEAMKHIEKIIKKEHNRYDIRKKLGRLYYDTKKYKQAIEQQLEVMRQDETDYITLNELGLSYLKDNQVDTAKDCFEKIVNEIKKDYPNAWFNLGLLNIENGEIERARDCFNKTIKLNPDYNEMINKKIKEKLESILREVEEAKIKNNLKKAQKLSEKALNLDPKNKQALNALKKINKQITKNNLEILMKLDGSGQKITLNELMTILSIDEPAKLRKFLILHKNKVNYEREGNVIIFAKPVKKEDALSEEEKIQILFLAANPEDTVRLRIDKEMREVDHALKKSKHYEKFKIKDLWSIQIDDLQESLLEYNPTIVHFSGHGKGTNEIILENEFGEARTVTPKALENLFAMHKDHVRCVVLNACFSKKQAEAIGKHIDCVVGMSKKIDDDAAINFSAAFYQALGYGKSVEFAFKSGLTRIKLKDLNEEDVPQLVDKKNIANEIIFVVK
ncbi:MAG: tetratricopeptide repeat protein [Candidatus Heimdallarchaeota archaeon]